jgi:hypothetical protein
MGPLAEKKIHTKTVDAGRANVQRLKSLEGNQLMFCYRARLSIACVVSLLFFGSAQSEAFAQAGTITKDMQNNCTNDYKKFCGDYGLQTAALNLCMRKAGPSLSPACVQALVKAGKVSQAEVDKVKAQAKGRNN